MSDYTVVVSLTRNRWINSPKGPVVHISKLRFGHWNLYTLSTVSPKNIYVECGLIYHFGVVILAMISHFRHIRHIIAWGDDTMQAKWTRG